jgi:hypothetical protein
VAASTGTSSRRASSRCTAATDAAVIGTRLGVGQLDAVVLGEDAQRHQGRAARLREAATGPSRRPT